MKSAISYLKTLFSEPDKKSHLWHVLAYGGLIALFILATIFQATELPQYPKGLFSSLIGYTIIFVYGYFREQHHKKHPEKGTYEKRDIVANGIAAVIGIIILPLLLLLPASLPWM